jgi:hypothetical protein
MITDRPDGHLNTNTSEPWSKADLLFLTDTLKHGMSFAEVAGFLRGIEDEVREKAKELNR